MARKKRGTSKEAFTLLELILVLAIMVAIGAIVAPSFGEAFLRQRLQSSADRLRGDWERARLTAMKTGQTQMFSCVLASRDYVIQPYLQSDDMTSASAGATLVTLGGTVAQQDAQGMLTTSTTQGQPKQLEEEVEFVSCSVNADMRAVTIAQTQGGLAGAGAANQMVLFYPDGSTSTAEVIVQLSSGAQRAVRMRGLTGTTQVLIPGTVPTAAPATQ